LNKNFKYYNNIVILCAIEVYTTKIILACLLSINSDHAVGMRVFSKR